MAATSSVGRLRASSAIERAIERMLGLFEAIAETNTIGLRIETGPFRAEFAPLQAENMANGSVKGRRLFC